MTKDQPWTIERIVEALGDPALAQRFINEIHQSTARELLAVFEQWARVAKNTRDASEIMDAVLRSGEPTR